MTHADKILGVHVDDNLMWNNHFQYVSKKISSYVGHPISSDIGLISQKLLLNSEFYNPLHVAMGVAYSCVNYGVFITT